MKKLKIDRKKLRDSFVQMGYDARDVQILYVHSESKSGMGWDAPQTEIDRYLKKYRDCKYFDIHPKNLRTSDNLYVSAGVRVFYKIVVVDDRFEIVQ